MGTLSELKARILNEMKRPALTAEVAQAVTDAIEFYAPRSFWFNTVLDETITTTAGTAAYSIPSRFRGHQFSEITIGSERMPLCDGMSWEDYRYLQGSSTPPNGQPTEILFFGDSLYLWPTPAEAYLLSMTYSSALAELTDGDNNAWTNEAEPLIRARSKWDLYHNVVRDYAEAEQCASEERRWYGLLQGRDMVRRGPTRIVASTW